ncbi:repressor LexA [Candidatus Uhrbacteria bacterium CG_4_9_14_3_um_filter_36_7]|uniref:LexA repressor n=1 Tax=Candidatus Uhrbacteria bacterium CG_4_9_14_3_um_filter_36_7 TaxID=1975033 RepID=A0A2M7XEU1_9BACT|nr:MAG: repressor LexA [Candidatus Uhrbacteria bacterium CG_4_9_14_3_um_filter_36_7]
MTSLTKKQSEIFSFLKTYIQEHGYAPSYREIAKEFHLSSVATIHQYIKTLVEKGMVQIGEDGEARSIEIKTSKTFSSILPAPSLYLPLSGLITAGEPIEAMEEKEMIAIPTDLIIDGGNSYVLRVKGRSMIDDGILDGDLVIIERNPSPQNGDVVVALLDNTFATLKRFYREKNHIRLQPANRTMNPIFVKDCIVQGVVRAVIRKFQPI